MTSQASLQLCRSENRSIEKDSLLQGFRQTRHLHDELRRALLSRFDSQSLAVRIQQQRQYMRGSVPLFARLQKSVAARDPAHDIKRDDAPADTASSVEVLDFPVTFEDTGTKRDCSAENPQKQTDRRQPYRGFQKAWRSVWR
jgi:hypothetical protein